MFPDFKGFTQFAEVLSPRELIQDLDACFVQFDKITERYNLEKLKTIGDSYMCAGGPKRNQTHAIDCVLAAGVIGEKKFAYDVWGDRVNTASRMKSSGTPGRINISGGTYELVKGLFDCEFRGYISAKSKGEVAMYYVNGLKRSLAGPAIRARPTTASGSCTLRLKWRMWRRRRYWSVKTDRRCDARSGAGGFHRRRQTGNRS